jgi:hypothetical protein
MRSFCRRFDRPGPDNLTLLKAYYSQIVDAPADLNATMMLAWRDALNLRFLVEDGILYMFADWDDNTILWGPPIGDYLTMESISRSFEYLQQLGAGSVKPYLCYLWESYSLWPQILKDAQYAVIPQGREYLYGAAKMSELPGPKLRKKRQERNRFLLRHAPVVLLFSEVLSQGCTDLLAAWADQRRPSVSFGDRMKFELEIRAAERVFRDRIPVEGIVVAAEGKVQAFSLGAEHSSGCFNCMFEKANLRMRGAASFVFSELARYCVAKSYSEINAGEDWNVGYLQRSKEGWRPDRVKTTYLLQKV